MKIRLRILCVLVMIASMATHAGAMMPNHSFNNNMENTYPPKDYEKEWKKADSLISKGLPQSALEVVQIIYRDAKSSGNDPQFLKAVLYKLRLESDYQEDYMVRSIDTLLLEIKPAKGNIRAIMHSMLAEMYWAYYQSNRNNFLTRSQTIGFKQEDIHTWDARKIIAEVISHYRQSLENPASLQAVRLDDFDPILYVYDGSKNVRPTLYDFLAHRAIDFFSNSESGLTQPSEKFELREDEYLASTQDFIAFKVSTSDTFSLKYYAVQLFRDLVAFHIKDQDPKALIDAEIKRLKFCYKNSLSLQKDSLYVKTLIQLDKKFKSSPASTELSFEIASYFFSMASKYRPLGGDEYKWDYKTAMDYCQQAVSRFPDSYGAQNCVYLMEQIRQQSLTLTVEAANVPGKAFRALADYRNTGEIYLRLIRLDPDKNRKLLEKSNYEQLAEAYKGMKPLKEWSVKLPDDGDFQAHSAEIAIPAQDAGLYLILASGNKEFSFIDKQLSWASCWVTRISFVNRQKEKGAMDFYLVDRETGEALKGVKAMTYTRDYNYTSREYEYNKWKDFQSDENGYFGIPANLSKSYEYKYFYADFELGNDRYSSNSYFYQYPYYEQEEKATLVSYYFLDRAIYRPGQTIYFKGILLKKSEGQYVIMPNHSTTVTFYDVNYQKVAELYMMSNEYGTFHGSFTAPSSGLTGQMSLGDDYGKAWFSVEEYKRPKFEVEFLPVKGTYKLGEKVTVTGQAKAYAGNAVDGANVKYRVVRNGRFPYWGLWWGYYCPTSPQMEILNGEMITDDDGRFSIDFTAIPDLSVGSQYKPVFDYTVYADVTDINGETHSSQIYVTVGYTALNVSVYVPATVNKTEEQEFNVYTTNYAGVTEHSDVQVKIWALKQPGRIFRERLWAQPDRYTLSAEEYRELFPLDLYADENSIYKWDKGDLVFEESFNTGKDSVIEPRMQKWEPGTYMLIISAKDKYGTDVESRSYFTVYGPDEQKIPLQSTAWFADVKSYLEPGETAAFLFGTRENDLRLLYEIEFDGQIVEKQWLRMSDEMKRFEIPITEQHRGNLMVHLMLVKDNRCWKYDHTITVPYTNMQLELEFETFRDKLQPGQKEEWRMTVKGMKGDKVAAEILAAMYDASLDAYRANYWYLNILNYRWSSLYWNSDQSFARKTSDSYTKIVTEKARMKYREYDYLNWFGYVFYNYYNYGYKYASTGRTMEGADFEADYFVAQDAVSREESPMPPSTVAGLGAMETSTTVPMAGEMQNQDGRTDNGVSGGGQVQVRKNFNETAFFYPQLMTNEKGEVVISFTIPEALTRWKFMALAHTKDLKTGQIQKEVVTQKELMVVPNAPRFFRENDKIFFSAKISNISDKDLSGEAVLHFFDATTMKPLDEKMGLKEFAKAFSLQAGKSDVIFWEVGIPEGVGAITYRITAKAGSFGDGEEMAIPVLTNRMLVTESLPLPINGRQSKEFHFTKLEQSGTSSTLRQHKLTLEFSSNPAWYAVQALPYLMEYPYECSEQVFNRFYANSIAAHVANSSPRIKQVFDAWKNFTPDALLSNLEKNQDLKNVLLEETPWVLEAKNESERKQRVALLFDLNRMSDELERSLTKLEKKQTSNGGWAWFDGMPDDRYITQYIVTGFGHLDHLGIKRIRDHAKTWGMVHKAVKYLDDRIREDYDDIRKYYPKYKEEQHIGYTQVQYLYARSYFTDVEINASNQEAVDYFKAQAAKYWTGFNRYCQGMIALGLHRFSNAAVPADIIKSLKETALHNEEMGMYWRDMSGGYYWYQAPIETQALLIECFDEVANDQVAVEEMKIWLLKQKQTQDWKTTKATAEACYALLLKGTDVLAGTKLVDIEMGTLMIDPYKIDDVKVEAGTGYFKTSWSGGDVKPEMGHIKVKKSDDGVAWGAVYWQYFEQLDKITPAETPLKLEKKLFRTLNTPTGPVIEPVTENTRLKVGDKLKVRIELRVDRDMEYVHMKDMRASGFEPTNVISKYKYQDGLGYYESTRDAATNFFFSWLPKGTYVFEYPMFVTHKGDFSNGVTTIQCMYAPEFSSHSEGIRVRVEE